MRGHARWLFGFLDWRAFGYKEPDLDFDIMGDFYDHPPSGGGREAQLARLHHKLDAPNLDMDYGIVQSHWSDPDFLAAFVLNANDAAPIPDVRLDPNADRSRIAEEEKRRTDPRLRAVWREQLAACNQGVRLEPQNGFFPAQGAAAADALGLVDVVVLNLERASDATAWDDHVAALNGAWRSTMRSEYGYRGYIALGTGLYAVPPTRDISLLAREVARMKVDRVGVSARRGLIRAAVLAYQSSSSASRSDQSAQIVAGLASYGPYTHDPLSIRRKSTLVHVHEVASQVSPGDLAYEKQLREMIASLDYRQAFGASLDYDPVYDIEAPESAGLWDSLVDPRGPGLNEYWFGLFFLALSLSVGALIAVASGLGQVPDRWTPRSPALPGLTAALACSVRIFGYTWSWHEVGVCAGFAAFYLATALIATRPRLELIAQLIGFGAPALAVFGLAASVGFSSEKDLYQFLLFPVCLYTGLLLRFRSMRSREPSRFFLWPQIGVLAFTVLAVPLLLPWHLSWPLTVARSLFALAILFGTVAAWQCVSFGEAARQVRRYSYWVWAAVSLAYGMVILWQVAVDRRGLAMIRHMESPAVNAHIRAWAHEHPEGLMAKYEKEDRSAAHN